RFDGVREQFARVGEMPYQWWDFGEHPIQRVGVVGDDRQEFVGRIDCAGEVVASAVQFGGECGQPPEEFVDLIDVTVEDLQDLRLDHVEVRDAAAGEDDRDAGQGPFDRGVGRRIHQPDGVTALQRLR